MTDYGANFYYEAVMSPPVSPMTFQQPSPYPLPYQQQQQQQQMPMMQQPPQQQQQYYQQQPQQMQAQSPGVYSQQQELLDYLHSNSSSSGTSSPSSHTGTTFSGFSSGFSSPSSGHNQSPIPYAAAVNSPVLQNAVSLPAESPLRLTFNIKRKGKPLKNLYWTFRCSGQTRTPLSIEMTASSCRFCLNCLNEIEDRPSTPHGPCRCGSTSMGTLSDIRFTPYLFNCIGGCYYGHLHNVIREKDEFIELPSEFPTDQHTSPTPVVNHGAPFDPSMAYANGAAYGGYPQQQQQQQQYPQQQQQYQQQMPIDYSLNGSASPYSGYSSPLSTSSSLPPTLGYIPPYGVTPPPSDMVTSNGYYGHSGGTPSLTGSDSPSSSGALSPAISLPTSVCHSYVLPQNVKIKPKKISDNNLHCHIGINVTIGATTFSFGDQISQVGGAFDYYQTNGAPHKCADCCFLLDRKSGPDYFVNGNASICCEILAVTEFETEEQQPVINKYFGGLISPAFIATSRAIKAESITCFRVPPQVKSSYSQSAVVKPLMMTNCDGNLSRSIDGSMTDGPSFFYDASNSIVAVDFAIVQETLRTLLPNSYLDWSEILQRYLELSQINGGGDQNCHQQTGSLLTSLKSCPPPGAALSSSAFNQESLQRLLDRINKSKQFLEEQMESLKHSSELSPIRTNIFREGGLDRSLGLQPSLRQHAVEVLSAITSIVVESRAPNPNTSSTSRSITQDFSRSPFANLAATSAPPQFQPQYQQQPQQPLVGMKVAGLTAAPAPVSISFPQPSYAPAPSSYAAPAPSPYGAPGAIAPASSPYGTPGASAQNAYSVASQSLSSQSSVSSGYGQFPPTAYDQSSNQAFAKSETAAYPPSPVPAFNPNQTTSLPSSYPVPGSVSHCVGTVHPHHHHSASLVQGHVYQNPNELVQRMAETSLDPKAEKKLKKKLKKEQQHIIKHEKKEAKKAHKNSKGMVPPPPPTVISLASGGPVSVSSSIMSSASRNASPIHSSFLGSTRVVRVPPSQRAPPLPSQITQGLPSISLSFVRFSPETEARARKEFVPPSRWMLTFAKEDPIQYFVSNLSHEQWSMAFTIKLSKRFSSDSQTQQIEVPPFSVNNGFALNISHYLFSIALLHTCFDIQADITFLFKSASGRSACNQSQFFIDAHPAELEDY
eukprot:TRINITY_DN835_c1_g1_i5.p1 TRINITY_DN835_c1_g1~~TRINITY_DN835_c1_g1_i5.p1  ORF type:complete len:1165 (+),score=556.84 TRINITY_DN835_c1_g1_i5:323-3817(+)